MRNRSLMIITLSVVLFIGSCGNSSNQINTIGGEAKMMIIETTLGKITFELFPDKAPMTVDIISGLAEGTKDWTHPETGKVMEDKPYYDGVLFHRVIPNFMIQTGDPTGTGRGGPGFQFDDEFHQELTFDQPGRLAMANRGPNTNGGQIFITVAPTPHLNGAHTIFGQVTEGQEIVTAISEVSTVQSRPIDDVEILGIQIVRGSAE